MNSLTKYASGVTLLVGVSGLVAYFTGTDIAVVWAAITMTCSLWALARLYPRIRQQQPNNTQGNTAVLAGMIAGFVVPAFIYVITPLAFGGLVGVAVSAAMQSLIGYRGAIKGK